MIVGIDFDNTIVSYDDLMYRVAVQRELISHDVGMNKKTIRDVIRKLPKGEVEWQKLQAYVYGKGIADAQLIIGVKEFVKDLRRNQVDVFVVSHKTEFASMDPEGVNLRDVALTWMDQNKFFDSDDWGFNREMIFFESTRKDKIERIKKLHCTHFIDDLEETFLESSFPSHVEKILYGFLDDHSLLKGVKVFNNWRQILEYFCVGYRK